MTKPKRKSRYVLILLTDTGASTRDFLSGFSRFSRSRRDWHMRLRRIDNMDASEFNFLASQGGYDGIITNEDVFLAHPEISENPDTAVVVFGTYSEVKTPAPIVFVQNDNDMIGRFAAQYFMQLGRFRSFGFVPTYNRRAWSDVRAAAFRSELTANACDCRIFDASSGISLEDWLVELPKPAAVMSACDRVAVEVVASCASAKLNVPSQVSLLGVDNDELLCEFDSPTLSSILPRHDTTGILAAKALNRLFHGWRPESSQRILCDEMEIVERESTASPSPATHLIQSALEFIRQNVRRNITASDVVRHLKVSPSLANLRFREFHGKTIGETIQEERLNEACRTLSMTSLPIRKIAKLCGFPNASHFGALFRRRFGTSPGQWRQSSPKTCQARPRNASRANSN